MTPTVADAGGVVNPVHPNLGHGVRDLYDWLRSKPRSGRTRHVRLTPPVSRYEQVAILLRLRIFSGEFPPGSLLPSGPELADTLKVSQPVVQRAFEVLGREGLVRTRSGSGTAVLERKQWRIEFSAPIGQRSLDLLPQRGIAAALADSAEAQPAVGDAESGRSGDEFWLRMIVESADLGGAVTIALPVAQKALGSMPVVRMTAEEA